MPHGNNHVKRRAPSFHREPHPSVPPSQPSLARSMSPYVLTSWSLTEPSPPAASSVRVRPRSFACLNGRNHIYCSRAWHSSSPEWLPMLVRPNNRSDENRSSAWTCAAGPQLREEPLRGTSAQTENSPRSGPACTIRAHQIDGGPDPEDAEPPPPESSLALEVSMITAFYPLGGAPDVARDGRYTCRRGPSSALLRHHIACSRLRGVGPSTYHSPIGPFDPFGPTKGYDRC